MTIIKKASIVEYQPNHLYVSFFYEILNIGGEFDEK